MNERRLQVRRLRIPLAAVDADFHRRLAAFYAAGGERLLERREAARWRQLSGKKE